MKINGRFLLLAVATGLFIRLWSNADGGRPRVAATTPATRAVQLDGAASSHGADSPHTGATSPRQSGTTPHESGVPQPTASAKPRSTETATTRPVSPGPTVAPPHQPPQPADVGRVEEWSLERPPFRLPALSEGTWRVVDDTGRVAVLQVAAGRGTGAGSAGEFHVHPVGGVRWYFIRLNAAETAASPLPGPATSPADLAVATRSDRGAMPVEVPGVVASDNGLDALADTHPASRELPAPAVEELRPARVWTDAELAERAAVAADLQRAAEMAAEDLPPTLQARNGSLSGDGVATSEVGDPALLPSVADDPVTQSGVVDPLVVTTPTTVTADQPGVGTSVPRDDSALATGSVSGQADDEASALVGQPTTAEAVLEPIPAEPAPPTPDAAELPVGAQLLEQGPTGDESAVALPAEVEGGREQRLDPVGLERLGGERPDPVDLPEAL